MPKGGKKRTNKEYEQEIEDAIRRFKKYPERLIAASDSDEWIDFLQGIGISDKAIEGGSDFWEQVREGTLKRYGEYKLPKNIDILSQLIREYENRQVYVDTTQKGSVYREIYSERKIVYRDVKTGRFTKKL